MAPKRAVVVVVLAFHTLTNEFIIPMALLEISVSG